MNAGSQSFVAQGPVRARPNWVPQPPSIAPALAGRVEITPRGPFPAGSLQTISLTYTAGRYGIDDTGTLRVCFRFATDQGQPQFDDPSAANYVTVAASNGAVLDVRFDYKLNTRPFDRTLVIRVVKGYLREGETITVRFGDPKGGSPGYRLQTFADPFHEFQVLVDPIACGHYVRVPDQPTIAIVAGPAAAFVAVLPTRCAPGASVALGLRAEDRWGNPADVGGRTLRLRGSLSGLPSEATFPPGAAALRLDGLTAGAQGVVAVEVSSTEGEVLTVSNPLVIAPDDGLLRLWGDLHAQSGETIGSSSAHDYLRFARDIAFLDAVGHQGNDFQITAEFWQELNDLMGAFNAPGRFITVPGYEWSGNTGLGGDRNVFFGDESGTIRRSSHALVPDRSDEATDCVDARALFSALRTSGDDVICWAHCGGRYADIQYAHDVALERAVEVHSSWGTFEWLLADAFALGYRVGVVASSDGHKGRPGAEPPGASMFGALGGLTCFLAARFDRAALFEAMRARHHYGTTGCRLDLDVRADLPAGSLLFRDDPALGGAEGHPAEAAIMGDIVRAPSGTARLSVAVSAASPIVALEIRDGAAVLETVRPGAEAPRGRRIVVTWAGAEYRGRFRQSIWDGGLVVEGNRILAARPINFFNPDKPLRVEDNSVRWLSVTTGNFAGVELTLGDPEAGMLRVETPNGTLACAIADLGAAPLEVPCGKLERRLSAYRLPDTTPCAPLTLVRDIAVGEEERRILVAVTLEDGHRAWSSPIYLLPEGSP
ncbi:DUF3604 domain-containing protein [Aquabacter spiritensis]|uniref:Uncharacterized protein DUF3604 n=1 Tax=Aquabacter spiritensis TaxID=933073 RepID=A0A4R3M3R7_9HYPH|nr:DUF3604 domain-containing protein [Aquabacter spiritensis]TCT07901.1 uncharacterized protein DUF3604 [Aquabacter spiritensis]